MLTRRDLLAGVAGLVLAPACAAHMGRGAGRKRGDGVVRVLTLNVAHGRARAWMQSNSRGAGWYRRNLDVVGRVIAREKPDIVALQEAELGSRWAGMFDHVAYLAEKAELEVVAATPFVLVEGRFRYGTALLADAEVLQHGGTGFRAHGRWPKGYTFARVRLEAVEVTIVSVHLDHASAPVRHRQVLELAEVLAQLPGPYIVMGDFNATWGSPESAVRELAQRLGLRTHDPSRRYPSTYPFLRRRLDWILVSPDAEFVGYHVLTDDRLSDHRPVIADLRIA